MDSLKLGIELVLKGAEQVASGIKGVTNSVKAIGDEFRAGVVGGMEQAVKDANRPLSELKKVAEDARKALSIRPDFEIQAEIDKTRQAYDDLKASGQATSGELIRAKEAMRVKIGELRVEMGKWSGDWTQLGKKAEEAGAKMMSIGAKMSIAGAPAFMIAKNAMDAEHDLASIANTAGIKAAQSGEVIAKWRKQINELAHETNQKQSDITQALGALVAKGLDPDKAIQLLRPIGDAATATGGQIDDIAKTIFATYDNLKTPIGEAAKTLDILALAGNKGSFELKDMAQYFPSLTGSAMKLNMVGIQASASIAAAAQISRKATGDASTAANNLKNFLDKLLTPETAKNFEEMGVNLSAMLKKGMESGDLIGYMAKEINRITGGSGEKLSQLFSDVQARDFASIITQNIGEYQEIRDAALKASGTVQDQKDTILATTNEKLKGINIDFSTAVEQSKTLQWALDKVKETAEWFAANPDVFGPIAAVVSALAVGGVGVTVAGTALAGIGTALGVIGAAWTSGALAAALPAIGAFLGVVAAWKVGQAFGTWLNEQINIAVESLTGSKNLGSAIYDFVQWLKELPSKAVAALKAFPGEMKKIGGQIIDGLVEGIKAKAAAVVDSIKNMGGAAVRELKDLLGIKSPSKVFMVIGEQIGEGMAIGMTMKVPNVHEAAKKLGIAAAYGAKDKETALWIKGQLKDYDALVTDLEKEAERTAKDKARAAENMQREAERLTDSLRTDLEKSMDEMDRYHELLDAGAITWDTYARAVAKAHEAMSTAGSTAADGAKPGSKYDRDQNIMRRSREGATTSELSREFGLSMGYIEKIIAKTEEADTVWGQLRGSALNAVKGMEDAIAGFIKTGKFDFRSFADSVISDLARIAAKTIMKPAYDWVGSFFSSFIGNAQGGAYGGAGIAAYQNTVVTKPTLFPFATGVGLMGEKSGSPGEAIMPLARMPSGNLGVESSGGGNITVNIINNANGTQATTRERKEGDNRILDVLIEQVDAYMAGGVTRGSSKTASAIQSTYGLSRAAGAF